MADTVDNMTAAELRTKLAEYGLPVMPITASTRNLMVKKLKMVMENKSGGKNADGRRSLAKYSSGEESDLEWNKTTKEKAKNRRQTVGGAMPPPVTSKLRRSVSKKADSPAKNAEQDKDSESENEPVKTHEEVKTVTTRRITKTYKQPTSVEQEEYETGSDSEVDAQKINTSYRSPLSRAEYITNTLPSATSRPSPLSSYSSTEALTNDLNSIRSRLGLSQNYADKPSYSNSYSSGYTSSYKAPLATEEIDSPYLSSFTQRLSALKADSRNSLKDAGNGGGGTSYSSTYRRRNDTSPDLKTVEKKYVLKNNLVSFAIVGLGFIFFVGVAFMYMGMKEDASQFIEDKNNNYPICQSNVASQRPKVNCVLKTDLKKAKDLLEILNPELNSRAVAAACGKPGKNYMTERDVINLVQASYPNKETEDIITDLYNAHVLILNNPKWRVSLVTVDTPDEGTALTSMDYVNPKRLKGEIGLAILQPTVPWRCLVFGKLYSLIISAVVIAFVIFVVFSIHKGVQLYVAHRKRQQDQIYSMVEQIIDVVSQDSGEDTSSVAQAMPVTHVRDMLIAPQNRESLSVIWDAAIDFITKNESRIRFEEECVAGEEYCTLRWVSPQGSPRSKGSGVWQGQAFETQEGSVNNLTISPTPCLKIRHMVDKNDKNPNKIVIQDAILEKCGPQVKILHVAIDKSTSCVYVKCASKADAGLVYQSLHGWWYEGNLITVKYLRLQRYMDHFPTSPSVGPFLKVSTQ